MSNTSSIFNSGESSKRKKQRGVFEREPGSGEWSIQYFDQYGRRRREKVGSKSAAIAAYQKRKTEIREGRFFPEKLKRREVSFAELATDALAYSKAHKRSYDDDIYRMERLLSWFRDRAADSITPQEIEQHFTRAADENNWAPATVNRLRALLSLVYRLGIQNGKAKENPARLVKHRQENNARVRWLAAEEEARLRAAIQATCQEHTPELDLALNTGLRLSEMYGLTWNNVNLSQRVLTVPRSKNGEMRHIPLNSVAIAALAALRQRYETTGFVCGGAPGPRRWFEPAVRATKLRDFTWHCLRHTFASRLVMAGVDLRTVQELMGHKSIQMTVRYSHLAPKHTLAAVERLAASVTGQPTATRTATEPTEPVAPESAYVH